MERNANVERVTVRCDCGTLLAAPIQFAGKQTKCPTCGQPIMLPSSSALASKFSALDTGDTAENVGKTRLVALWSLVGLFAFGCGIFLAWDSYSSHQKNLALATERKAQAASAANDCIANAVDTANEWLETKSPIGAEKVERQLTDSLKDKNATQKDSGKAVLGQVIERREQFAEEDRQQQLQQEATSLFENAKRMIDQTDIAGANTELNKYIGDPHAAAKNEAQCLLAEIEIATSNERAFYALIAMDDAAFDQIKAGASIDDGKVTVPALLTVRQATIQRNYSKAAERREQRREEQRAEKEDLEKRHQAELAELAESERLKTRTRDVRNVCWGDSRAIVKRLEGPELKEVEQSLHGSAEVNGTEAKIEYSFYDDKLVEVKYHVIWIPDIGPRATYASLARALTGKYGEGQSAFRVSDPTRNDDSGFNFRITGWELPRHSIALASLYSDDNRGSISLTYSAKSAEAQAFKLEQEKVWDEKSNRDL